MKISSHLLVLIAVLGSNLATETTTASETLVANPAQQPKAGTTATQAASAAKQTGTAQQSVVFLMPADPAGLHVYTLAEVLADGRVALQAKADQNPLITGVTEGQFLGIAASQTKPGVREQLRAVLRVSVMSVEPKGRVIARMERPAQQELGVGGTVYLTRPPTSTTNQMRALPDWAPLSYSDQPFDVPVDNRSKMAAARYKSLNNLKHIGLAMHNFHATNRFFPPAVVYGPDGKAWHSWRVLILPYIAQQPLYDRYDFSVPWDSPKNREVLERMPAVFRDPIHGASTTYTDYAAITGAGTVFPSGIQLGPGGKLVLQKGPNTVSIARLRDGTSNTIMVGSVHRGRKIPWTKPEDIRFGKDFAGIGRPGNFAAPYRIVEQDAGVFLFSDGSVRTIAQGIAAKTMRALLTIGGREVIDPASIPILRSPASRNTFREQATIRITRTGGKVTVELWHPKFRPLPRRRTNPGTSKR